MPHILVHSANVREMIKMFERSVIPTFHAEDLTGKKTMSFENFVGVGPRITGPDGARRKMLDVMNAIQFMELDRVMGREDELHYVIRTYNVYKLARDSLDEMQTMNLECVGGKATVKLLLRACRGEFDRLVRAVWILNVTAKFGIWAEKKAMQIRAWRARAT